MSGIFLSYRRDDASGWAGRLYEHLAREWGSGQVFMDIDTIAPGEDFREAIRRTIDSCDVVLVVIGPNWISARDEAGNRRLDDEGDTHRAEVAAALAAGDVRVIPVLVGGAGMPKVTDLPAPLVDLAYRNAAVVEDRRFASDVDDLQRTLNQLVGSRPTQLTVEEDAPASEPGSRRRGGVALGSGQRLHGGNRGSPRDQRSTTLPAMLALLGMVLVLVWAVVVPRAWHNEVWGIRVGAGSLTVVLGAAGLRARQWTWVLAAGIGGLTGLAVWLLQLIGTHADELPEIFLPGGDGVPNAVSLVGMLLVLAAGFLGSRARSGR